MRRAKLKDVIAMMGHHHVRIGLMSGAAVASLGAALCTDSTIHRVVPDVQAIIIDWAVPWIHGASGEMSMNWTLCALGTCAATITVAIGSLFPDIDSRNSRLGRHVHLPLRHRGWTHTDWLLILVLALSFVDPTGLSVWFFVGLLSHDVTDELSVAGRVHFYPLTKHKVITPSSDESIVVSCRYQGLYTTGSDSTSEKVVYRVLMVSCAIVIALSVWWMTR